MKSNKINVKYHINEGKRTIAATLIVEDGYGYFESHTGLARCAPEDVFDVELGKALALLRAKRLSLLEARNAQRNEIRHYAKIVDRKTKALEKTQTSADNIKAKIDILIKSTEK